MKAEPRTRLAAGFTNQGAINLSGGFTDVFGDVTQTGSATIIVHGGATATFYNNFTQNGAEFRTSIGSQSIFFGVVNGTGPFTGTGETYFEGSYSPGNSPAIVTLTSQVTFTPSNILTMEIGGLDSGLGDPIVDDGYDQLIFTNDSNAQVTWGGTLRIDLINNFTPQPGQSFKLFDFDPTRDAGTFASIEVVDLLPPGTAFDFSQIYTTGEVLVVVPEPSFALFLATAGVVLLSRRRRWARQGATQLRRHWHGHLAVPVDRRPYDCRRKR